MGVGLSRDVNLIGKLNWSYGSGDGMSRYNDVAVLRFP